jgi:hypothetical protein
MIKRQYMTFFLKREVRPKPQAGESFKALWMYSPKGKVPTGQWNPPPVLRDQALQSGTYKPLDLRMLAQPTWRSSNG